MDDNLKTELSKYRFSRAKENLESAKQLFEAKLFNDSVGRSYYAIFSAIRAILALDGVDFKKHSGVISYFQKEYLKTKIFDQKYSDYVRSAFDSRSEADYRDFVKVSNEDALNQLNRAKEMLEVIKKYLKEVRNIDMWKECKEFKLRMTANCRYFFVVFLSGFIV